MPFHSVSSSLERVWSTVRGSLGSLFWAEKVLLTSYHAGSVFKVRRKLQTRLVGDVAAIRPERPNRAVSKTTGSEWCPTFQITFSYLTDSHISLQATNDVSTSLIVLEWESTTWKAFQFCLRDKFYLHSVSDTFILVHKGGHVFPVVLVSSVAREKVAQTMLIFINFWVHQND